MMRLGVLTFALAGALPAQGYGAVEWVEADRAPLEGTQYQTFHSQTIGGDVNYRVYLPPGYGSNTGARYPVLYELPASGQSTLGGADVVKRVDQGIRAGRLAPMIVVLVNGLRGNAMYRDTWDGKLPLESVIIKDLLPHIDGAYRTVAARETRALDGFSDGGLWRRAPGLQVSRSVRNDFDHGAAAARSGIEAAAAGAGVVAIVPHGDERRSGVFSIERPFHAGCEERR
jgi:enterochelin esterase-like enzyme